MSRVSGFEFPVSGRSFFFHLLLVLIAFVPPVSVPALTSAEIDEALTASQKTHGVEPAGIADDASFLRRASLDVRGVVPSLEETISFLKDTAPDKRSAVIDKFLNSPERGDNWAAYWDKILIGTLEQPQSPEAQYTVKSRWRRWAAEEFNNNVAWDEFMRKTVTATGRTDESPETLPIARWRQAPESMAGSMSRAFLGTQIQCAQCHNHKTNPDLSQQKFWEFAAFFGATRVQQVYDTTGKMRVPANEVVDGSPRWLIPIPDKKPKMEVTPHYLDGTPASHIVLNASGEPMSEREIRDAFASLRKAQDGIRKAAKDGDREMAAQMIEEAGGMPQVRDTRRDQLAAMIASNDKEQFAANFVNRLWARYFGRGFVEPVEDWAEGAVPSDPDLLASLSAAFIASGYDVRALERLILNTQAYQRSNKPTATSAANPDLFAHAAVRPLGPDQLLDSFVEVTRGSLGGPSLRKDSEDAGRLERLRMRYAGQFVHTFNNDEMEWSGSFETSIPRALFLLNDSEIQSAIKGRNGKGLLDQIMKTTDDASKRADYLYVAVLSRRPTDAERSTLANQLLEARKTSADAEREFMEDALWSLMNSAEFLTNH